MYRCVKRLMSDLSRIGSRDTIHQTIPSPARVKNLRLTQCPGLDVCTRSSNQGRKVQRMKARSNSSELQSVARHTNLGPIQKIHIQIDAIQLPPSVEFMHEYKMFGLELKEPTEVSIEDFPEGQTQSGFVLHTISRCVCFGHEACKHVTVRTSAALSLSGCACLCISASLPVLYKRGSA